MSQSATESLHPHHSYSILHSSHTASPTASLDSPPRQLFWSRWIVFGACACITAIGGTGNALGLYSPLLKRELHFSQSELDVVASAGNIGLYSGIISGAFYGRYGVRACVQFGAALTFIGYLALYLIVARYIEIDTGAVVFVAAMQFLGQLGSSFLQTATTSTSVRNFPSASRGQVVGLIKGIFGLSASVLAAFYVGVLNSNGQHYLLFIALFCPIAQVIGTIPLNILPPEMVPYSYDVDQANLVESKQQQQQQLEEQQQRANSLNLLDSHLLLGDCEGLVKDDTFRFTGPISSRLPFAFAISYFGTPQRAGISWWAVTMVSLAVYLATLAFIGEIVKIPQSAHIVSVVIVILVLGGFLVLPLRHGPTRILGPQPKSCQTTVRDNNVAEVVVTSIGTVNGDIGTDVVVSSSYGSMGSDTDQSLCTIASESLHSSVNEQPPPPPPPVQSRDMTISLAIRTLNFWLMFASVFMAGGVGLVIINNIAQITASLRPSSPSASGHVTLIGFGNFIGRVLSGTISDGWPHLLSRPGFCSFASFLSCLAFLLMYFWGDIYVITYPVVILVGLTYGAWFCLAPTIAADLYGTKHHGAVYGAMALGPTVGSIFFSTLLVNFFYHSSHASGENDSTTCVGFDCFQNTYLVCAIGSLIATILTAIVARRARPIYHVLQQEQQAQARKEAKAIRVPR